ncbi:MBOAT family protein [Helicobacter jaachi]|uniref:MBOAT family protein n=1 Tax=Helicobacter jaachi TaxID=1677920 RepID=A0A4U8TES3_9HELI|nr:MBOAT family O-acyltransferase [Helicobacter jaachi]TLD97207.1 MBOAT family protein [Helicobacter jaachi]
MLFNSFAFIALVCVTLCLYYLPLLRSMQVYILIIASFVFYAYGQASLLILLLISASLNAIVSYLVYFSPSLTKRWFYALCGVSINLAILIGFKYSPLFAQVINYYASLDGIGAFLVAIPLPIGISFYTFQGISLVVDLYRYGSHANHQNLITRSFLRHYCNTIFFISFFPQLVAGPILKAHQFYPQICPKYAQNIAWLSAFKIIIIGYFLKMVIADNLKDQTFWIAYPYFEAFNALTLCVLLFGYSMQIFADFAGYSLIAIGVAKLFGYELPKNFHFPYLADSFADFWRRWHISLSTWLKEYLYIPLGGNRKGAFRTYLNLIIVMALGGLWHGAALSYIVWGLYHGILLAIERFLKQFITLKAHLGIHILKICFVFVCVSLGWLFFKLNNFSDALSFLNKIFIHTEGGTNKRVILSICFYALPVGLYYANHLLSLRYHKNLLDINLTYGVLLFLIATNSGGSDAFIYFQF